MRYLKAAVEGALEEATEISDWDPGEVLPKELQLVAAIYRQYVASGFSVQIEAGYPDAPSGTECDLRVRGRRGGAERWIEIKRVWSASGLVPKVGYHISSLAADAERLRKYAPPDARKYVVAFVFSGEQPRRRVDLESYLMKLMPEERLFALPARQFHWRQSAISAASAWAWEV